MHEKNLNSWLNWVICRRRLNGIGRFVNPDNSAFREAVNSEIYVDKSGIIRYTNDENSLSGVLTIAYLSSMTKYFKPIRELPAGKGFCDFVYIPKPEYRSEYPALVVELKWNKDAESAIDQIRGKKYPDSIKDYTDNILLVGISYDKKTHYREVQKS